jgi:hypothetical protein
LHCPNTPPRSGIVQPNRVLCRMDQPGTEVGGRGWRGLFTLLE